MTPEEQKQKLRDEIAAGSSAQQALEVLDVHFDAYERELIRAWRESALTDGNRRELVWQAIQVMDKVRSRLKDAAKGRRIAEVQLRELETLEQQKSKAAPA